MKALEKLDHPVLFVIALVFLVVAGQKVLAYLSGKAGLTQLSRLLGGNA